MLFLLFVLIPSLPITFFSAAVLSKSADLLLVPGIDRVLKSSLATIRHQVEERGKRFLTNHDDFSGWSGDLLKRWDIQYSACHIIADGEYKLICSVRHPHCSLPAGWSLDESTIKKAYSGSTSSTLIYEDKRTYIAYFYKKDSFLLVSVYDLEPYVVQSKQEIEKASGFYGSLYSIKESIIERNLIWAGALLIVLTLALSSIVVTKRISLAVNEPIEGMVRAMEKAMEGDLSQRVETKATGEFKFLIDSFNKMISELERSRERLIEAERIAAWQHIARRISHEIKNSISPIAISLHRIQGYFEGKMLPPSISDSLRVVEDELNSLKRMSEEFSEFARMPEPKKNSIDINDTVKSSVIAANSFSSDIEIEMQLSSRLPEVYADREQIKRVMINIIKNGIEASGGRGKITVNTRRSKSSDHSVEIEIVDKGRGIDERDLDRIFQPYYTTKIKGTGLGLAIVKKIIDDHGGKIKIKSRKNRGTSITICI